MKRFLQTTAALSAVSTKTASGLKMLRATPESAPVSESDKKNPASSDSEVFQADSATPLEEEESPPPVYQHDPRSWTHPLGLELPFQEQFRWRPNCRELPYQMLTDGKMHSHNRTTQEKDYAETELYQKFEVSIAKWEKRLLDRDPRLAGADPLNPSRVRNLIKRNFAAKQREHKMLYTVYPAVRKGGVINRESYDRPLVTSVCQWVKATLKRACYWAVGRVPQCVPGMVRYERWVRRKMLSKSSSNDTKSITKEDIPAAGPWVSAVDLAPRGSVDKLEHLRKIFTDSPDAIMSSSDEKVWGIERRPVPSKHVPLEKQIPKSVVLGKLDHEHLTASVNGYAGIEYKAIKECAALADGTEIFDDTLTHYWLIHYSFQDEKKAKERHEVVQNNIKSDVSTVNGSDSGAGNSIWGWASTIRGAIGSAVGSGLKEASNAITSAVTGQAGMIHSAILMCTAGQLCTEHQFGRVLSGSPAETLMYTLVNERKSKILNRIYLGKMKTNFGAFTPRGDGPWLLNNFLLKDAKTKESYRKYLTEHQLGEGGDRASSPHLDYFLPDPITNPLNLPVYGSHTVPYALIANNCNYWASVFAEVFLRNLCTLCQRAEEHLFGFPDVKNLASSSSDFDTTAKSKFNSDAIQLRGKYDSESADNINHSYPLCPVSSRFSVEEELEQAFGEQQMVLDWSHSPGEEVKALLGPVELHTTQLIQGTAGLDISLFLSVNWEEQMRHVTVVRDVPGISTAGKKRLVELMMEGRKEDGLDSAGEELEGALTSVAEILTESRRDYNNTVPKILYGPNSRLDWLFGGILMERSSVAHLAKYVGDSALNVGKVSWELLRDILRLPSDGTLQKVLVRPSEAWGKV